MEPTRDSAQHPQYLTFQVAGEEYAVGILRIREIIQFGSVTRVPRAPAWVRGVINLRGAVVPVVDLAVRFGLRYTPPRLGGVARDAAASPATAEAYTAAGLVPTRSSCIVVAEVRLDDEPVVMGLLTDAVSEVVELPAHDVLPAPPFGTNVRIEYLQGMGRIGERLVLLLDTDKLLRADEMVVAATLPGDVGREQAQAGAAVAEQVAS